MNTTTTTEALKAELAAILGGVRRRRRLRRAFLGTVWFLIAFTGVALLAALTVDAWRFAPEVVIVARIASYLLGAGALLYFVALPVLQRVSDGRLALYVEEHEPSLAMALASATEIAAQAGEQDIVEDIGFKDNFGRDTPRSSFIGFLNAAEKFEYEIAEHRVRIFLKTISPAQHIITPPHICTNKKALCTDISMA